MAIEKYAFTHSYGFGFTESNSIFVKECTIHVKDTRSIRFNTGNKKITLPHLNDNGLLEARDQPLYIIFENGVWKEFFTATPVKVVGFRGGATRDIYMDPQDPGSIISAKESGIREFIIYEHAFSYGKQFYVCDLIEFEHFISEYSDYEIKSMVSQFYELRENADKWVPQYEKIIDDAIQEWNNRTANATASLEKKMGAYTGSYYAIDQYQQATNEEPEIQESSQLISDFKKYIENLDERSIICAKIIIFICVVILISYIICFFFEVVYQ